MTYQLPPPPPSPPAYYFSPWSQHAQPPHPQHAQQPQQLQQHHHHHYYHMPHPHHFPPPLPLPYPLSCAPRPYDPLAPLAPPSPGAPPRPERAALARFYTVDRRLGRGANATVYLARTKRSRDRVAVKVIPRATRLATPVQRAALHRELAVLFGAAAPPHPHVLSGRHVHADADYVFVATEYCAGGDLFDVLQRLQKRGEGKEEEKEEMEEEEEMEMPQGVDEGVALGLVMEALKGIAHLHRHGLAHRDIKLDNLLLGADGRVRVADFDLACACGPLARSVDGLAARRCGSPQYVPPEAYVDARDASAGARACRSDGSANWWDSVVGSACDNNDATSSVSSDDDCHASTPSQSQSQSQSSPRVQRKKRPFRPDAADVWASGVTLFALLTHTLPFDHDDGAKLARLVVHADTSAIVRAAAKRAAVSDGTRDLLARLLHTDPLLRPSAASAAATCGALLRALHAARDADAPASSAHPASVSSLP